MEQPTNKSSSILLNAAKENNSSLALRLLSSTEDLFVFDDALSSHGWSILHWAVYHKNTDLVLAICSHQSGRKLINVETSKAYAFGLFNFNGKQTPLHIATLDENPKKHDREIIKILLENGANSEAQDQQKKLAISTYIVGNNNNRLTLRLWTKCLKAMEVGHITLQTYVGGAEGRGIYASFWPPNAQFENDSDHPLFTIKKNANGYLRTYFFDRQNEGREPDKIIDIYGLDVNAINEEFYRFSQSNFNWSKFPSTLIGFNYSSNCSGLVGLLLKAGGIEARLNNVDERILQGYSRLVSTLGKTAARGFAKTRVNNPVAGVIVLGAAIGYGLYNMIRVKAGNFFMPDDLYDLAEILQKHLTERLIILDDKEKDMRNSQLTMNILYKK